MIYVLLISFGSCERRLANTVGLQQTVMYKVLKVAESPKAADASMQDASDRIGITFALKKFEDRKRIKKTKTRQVKMSRKDCINAVCKKHLKYICQKCGPE